ncbi:MAG TPA: hypothetical protein VMS87_05940, partial [Roseiarcus sp.]|nr:hypothetical protein [Roseiarcus sp.]
SDQGRRAHPFGRPAPRPRPGAFPLRPRPGSRSGFTIARCRSFAPSDNPVYLAGRERIYEGMRMAGAPEG